MKDIENWSAPLGERLKPGRVIARWNAPASGKAGEESKGKVDPVLVLGELYESQGAARSAAEAAMNDQERDAAQLSLSLTSLRTDLGAGAPVALSGLRTEVDGAWTLMEVTHRATSGSARTSAIAQREAR